MPLEKDIAKMGRFCALIISISNHYESLSEQWNFGIVKNHKRAVENRLRIQCIRGRYAGRRKEKSTSLFHT